ncbi:hypothetical protein C1752_06597 [Acaryochloris thomasi RCC1774]|uniref:DUF547 domain-containing protein n=1 Tax=Acaryochloris thomasi RCC1774 TaxID=1764569 RepID=A0A2W1JBK2_9CYAN|nr:DUF547 domain-containing protein [Acaryochloris thomasi]PZD71318.1 hypothetical protein C1752_06597 [Acaryochloris thomasi RCC1774]
MKRRLSLILLPSLFLMGCTVPVLENQLQQPASSQIVSNIKEGKPFSYEDYATVLTAHVDDEGLVDYEALQQDREALDRFNATLAAVPADIYGGWSEPEKLAFLMNAYNSFTLQAIIDQEPLKGSIRNITGVWDITKYDIAGEKKTLDNIEHDTIRKEFDEPRIHAALVCAAMSCPILRNEPYTSEEVEAQLEDQTNIWIARPDTGFKIDREQKQVFLSKIFDWYGDDWKASYAVEGKFSGSDKERAVLNFVSNYVSPEDKAYLEQGDYEVKYLDYDWGLNKQ